MTPLEIKPMFVDGNKEGCNTTLDLNLLLELLVEDKRQTEKDEQDNSGMLFWKLEILSGSLSPPFCLRSS